jgi:NtrC-family two-component system sensor histidine kinase KinB
MILKTKLSLGLGFLFMIILSLAVFCTYYVAQSSQDAENILKNNYDSIVYSRNMLSALDDMSTASNNIISRASKAGPFYDYSRHLFEKGKAAFEKNLKDENNNITEIQEREYAQQLNSELEIYLRLCGQVWNGNGGSGSLAGDLTAAGDKMKHTVNSIYDLNLQAVVRKSQVAKKDTAHFMTAMALIATFCLLLALVYFLYFPFYISHTYSYLSMKMKELLDHLGIKYSAQTNDEALNILHAIDLLENTLVAKNGGKSERL